jgi:hypothetical protein
MQGYSFVGSGMDRTTITIDNNANVEDCAYYDAHVVGTLDGNSRLRGCVIDNLIYVKGYIEQCVLSPGTIVLAGSEEAHFLDCWSGQPGVGAPTIDMGGSGQALALRNYNGGIRLINKSGPESISVDLNSGQVKLGADITSGDIVLRGVGILSEDLSSGANVINDLVNKPAIADSVWSHASALVALADLSFVKNIEGGKWHIVGNQMIFYEEDNVTEVCRFNLFDSNGTPTMTDSYKRERV